MIPNSENQPCYRFLKNSFKLCKNVPIFIKSHLKKKSKIIILMVIQVHTHET